MKVKKEACEEKIHISERGREREKEREKRQGCDDIDIDVEVNDVQ